ncbi:uncharacterized protein BO97DRAFT_27794 [Aspergillus homomorphus CBS 101889]|uniref:ThuA-like domain-containing protein n=1 Tax=Aspergillus homomorphus (strain CBS 101889) TaxID=1450537 RepID=A0A395I6E2_ASPHC|nr:hypothetical protein BO97DRAFT_27794 [Aspergillus homomorphus CBS 101889]RAL13844.1 hypothetical protein BO97DRAFT_27794 [Aspergillus homomorphus CBS 101889]
MTAPKPIILLISLAHRDFQDEMYASLFDALSASAQVKRAKTGPAAIQHLLGGNNSNNNIPVPSTVIITDEGLTQRRHADVLRKLNEYAQSGGRVIVGLHFPSFTLMNAFDRFFGDGFGLPWTHGTYYRTVCTLNPDCVWPVPRDAALPGPFSVKALHVKGARPEERLLVPAPGQPLDAEPGQAAIACARIGSGSLVYCGDVNVEVGSVRLVLALCGV